MATTAQDPYAPVAQPQKLKLQPGAPLVDNNGVATHAAPLEQRADGGPTPAAYEPQTPQSNTGPIAPQTATAGGQDLYRNTLIQQMGQSETPSVNDPTIKAQLDPYRAEVKRSMDQEIRAGAESAFAGGQDFGAPERVAASARAGEKTGMMAADLVGREITARRDQIQDALNKFGATMDADQRRALEEKLAGLQRTLDSRRLDISERQGDRGLGINEQELALKRYLGDKDYDLQKEDFGIRREGLAQTGALGNRELDIRDKHGMGGLNVDMIRTLLQNIQFNKGFGLDVGKTQAQLNRDAVVNGMEG